MIKYSKIITTIAIMALFVIATSCTTETSHSTGWDYNNPENGGFEVTKQVEQSLTA